MRNPGYYVERLMTLHRDADPAHWVAGTHGKAPHKPLLLLCVLDLYRERPDRENRIHPSVDVENAFNAYWTRLYSEGNESTFSLPFFHLQYDEFWHLVGPTNPIDERARRNPKALREEVHFAFLDDELHALLRQPEWNRHLASVIVTANFEAGVHERLIPFQGK